MSAPALSNRLKGRSALITGASAGIGKACALALAAEGADLFLTGRKLAELKAVAAQCVQLGVKAVVIAGDLNDENFVRDLAGQAAEADILVNNAGILTYAPVLDVSRKECADMFATNVVAAYDIALAVAKCMVARKRGHMVFITSLSARNVNANAVVYAATKHALAAFAKGFRLELKGHNIKVTEIAPGMVATDIRKGITHPDVLKSIAARKFDPISAQDVAEALVYALTSSPGSCPDLIELRPTLG